VGAEGSKRIQVIADYASAKAITSFFLNAALVDREPPPPVRLPNLELVCRKDDLTIRASDSNGPRSIPFDRALFSNMSCALAMSGMAIREVGGDFAAFPGLAGHPLARDLASRSALREMRDLPAFDVLQDHPELRALVPESALVP